MEHIMNLNPSPFQKIKNGEKTIELRLYDEKRKLLQLGDVIIFVNTSDVTDIIKAKVIALHVFESFDELYTKLPLLKCEYNKENINSAKATDMNEYYSEEKQKLYGVVGIEVDLL